MQKIINIKFVNVLIICGVVAYLAEALYELFIDQNRIAFVNDLQVALLFLIYLEILKLRYRANSK